MTVGITTNYAAIVSSIFFRKPLKTLERGDNFSDLSRVLEIANCLDCEAQI
jgi:hypothetical protein